MAKNTEAFGGFDTLVDMIMRTEEGPKDVTKTDKPAGVKLSKLAEDDIDEEDNATTDLTPGKAAKETKLQVKDTIEKEENEDDDKEETDETEDETDVVEDTTDTDKDKGKIDTADLDEVEPEMSSFFATSLADKLGLELDKETKFEKLDDVIDLMSQVIEANSLPTYANEEVEEYDKYVRNGGNLKSFYDQVYATGIDPERLDLEKESDQKLAIEANLKNLGYKDERIKNTIKRYEDAEVLKDEAVDAVESIKEFQAKTAKTLLANQEKERIATEQRNQQFVDNVITYVNNLKDIQGVPFDSKRKKDIIDYIFRVSPDGSTQYQKAYASDMVKNLVTSAYYMRYGDSLISETSKKATDAALNKVRDKLKASKGKRNSGSGGSQGLGRTSPNFSTLSSLIINK
jgi:hypothetical protein